MCPCGLNLNLEGDSGRLILSFVVCRFVLLLSAFRGGNIRTDLDTLSLRYTRFGKGSPNPSCTTHPSHFLQECDKVH